MGQRPIENQQQCNTAAKFLKLKDKESYKTTSKYWLTSPYGCYFKTSTSKLYFNIKAEARNNGANSIRDLLCITSGWYFFDIQFLL